MLRRPEDRKDWKEPEKKVEPKIKAEPTEAVELKVEEPKKEEPKKPVRKAPQKKKPVKKEVKAIEKMEVDG